MKAVQSVTRPARTKSGQNSWAVAVAAIAATLLAGCAADATRLGAPTTGSIGIPYEAPKQRTAKADMAADAPIAQASDPQRAAKSVKVGLLLPLTGPGQAGLIADNMRKAAELAAREPNAAHLNLIIRDDKATPEGAAAAAQEAAGAGAEILLGPLFSKSVQAVTPVARQARLPVVAFSNDRQVAGQGVLLLSFLVAPEVNRVVAHAAANGKKRFIALMPDDSYGKMVEAAFREAVARHGGQVVALESYQPGANPMLESVRKLRDTVRGIEEHGDPIDALFMPGGEETLATLGPQLRQNDFNVAKFKVLGTGAMDYPNAGRDPAFLGAWFAAPDPRGFKDFSDKFAKAYGHAPPRIATLAFDAVGMAAALGNGPDGARFLASDLTRASGFAGADGYFRLSTEGVTERALAVLEVQAVGANVIDAAPNGFGGATARDRNAAAVPGGAGPRLN